ncbi:MAG: hypothetical protein JWQ64_2373 [Subtercola sp.]|jgi:hypothetical protein|nr:hypothetical protein [Subtercola sp.]
MSDIVVGNADRLKGVGIDVDQPLADDDFAGLPLPERLMQ